MGGDSHKLGTAPVNHLYNVVLALTLRDGVVEVPTAKWPYEVKFMNLKI